MIVQVLVELSSRSIDKTFDYLVPSFLEEKIKIGIRVLVSFGAQKLEGFVLSIKEEDEDTYDHDKLKEILEVIDEEVILNEELLSLGREISKMTLSTLISSYQVMLPVALKAKKGSHISKKIESFVSLSSMELEGLHFNDSQKKIIDIVKKEGRVLKSNLNLISPSSVITL